MQVVPFRGRARPPVLDAARTHHAGELRRLPDTQRAKALVRAAAGASADGHRGDARPDRGPGEYSTIRALGREVAGCSTVYYWPMEHRPVGENGKVGILHVKCAVGDGEWLFLSSANLTHQAFTINMELGMLVKGGTLARRVEQQFDQLVHAGHLREI
ncbi:MAG: phospholipase D-like domain-containing protein [Singulisphaera sp.]